MLTAKHRSARFSWAKERRFWQQSQWAKILWSDESVFEIVPMALFKLLFCIRIVPKMHIPVRKVNIEAT